MRSLFAAFSLVLALSVSARAVDNGGFESAANGGLRGWEASGSGVSVKPFASTLWSRTETVFNIAEYKTVRVYLGLRGGSGSVWFDNVRVEESEFSTLSVTNWSFEEGDADALSGWGQDAPGERTFRDTSVWTRFPGQGFGSGASARVTSAHGGWARIWQDVAIVGRGEPNVDYVLSFSWRAKDLSGDIHVGVYGVEKGGGLGRALPATPLVPPFPPERFGKNIAELLLSAPGEAGLSQRVELSAAERKRPCRVTAQVRLPRLTKGSVVLSVQAGADAASTVAEELSKPSHLWQDLSVNFVPGDSAPRIAIRVKAAAALVHVDNVRLCPATITPEPRILKWLPLAQCFAIPSKLTVGLEGNGGGVVVSALRLFSEPLKERTGTVTRLGGPLAPGERGVALHVAPTGRGGGGGAESYSLRVNRDRVTITGADERGALYGLLTLLELVQRTPNGENIFLPAAINDGPDLPFRGIYWGGGDRELMDRFARLRLNAVLIENQPYFSLDNPKARRQVEELFDYYRGLGIEPVPVLQSFGHAHAQLRIDPNVAEGTEVVDEELVLTGVEPVAQAKPNVIRTETSDIRITDRAGKQTYEEGRDYEVLPGTMEFGASGFKMDAPPFKVRRTAESRIPDGATVLADYDHVWFEGSGPYCPNEPRVYHILREAIRNTIRTLHPKYLHIGHDEPMQMGTDSRCRKSGRSNAENFAYEVWRLYRMAKAEDPDVLLMMWDDPVNPYSHGLLANSVRPGNIDSPPFCFARKLLEDPTAPAVGLLPKDIILNVWFYGSSDPPTGGLRSLEFFGRKGFATTGSPYADRNCARRWSVACKRARDAGLPCLGALATAWSGVYNGLEESARTAWRVPSGE